MRRIGIDVGGTNTDAVLIEDGKVSGAVKAPTSEDVTTGILDSLKALAGIPRRSAPTFDRLRRWITALMKCVVPIITPSMRLP